MKRCLKSQTAFVVPLVVFFAISSLFADEGALTKKTIDKFHSSFEMDTHTRVIYNSITNNDISSLALNREVLRRHNEIFSQKI